MDDYSFPAPWTITVFYRTKSGVPLDVEYEVYELEEIAQIIDLGPDINTILRIVIDYNFPNHSGATVEDVMLKRMQ
jgi:hypothetical protein